MSTATVLMQFSAAPPDAAPNEDRIGLVRNRTGIAAWVVDGATSVDPAIRLADGRRAGEWFADELSRRLAIHAAAGGMPADCLRASLHELQPAYLQVGGADHPDWARPLGAVSLLQLIWSGADWRVHSLHLADCPVLVHTQHTWALHEQYGREIRVREPDGRDALEVMKERRARIAADPRVAVLSLHPACVEAAMLRETRLPDGTRLLLASDGLARAWQEYALVTREALLTLIADAPRMQRFVAQLRDYEAAYYAQRPDRLFKSADDVSALLIALGEPAEPDSRPQGGWQ